MTMNRMFLRGIVVSFFLCLTGSLAFGASSRTFVASNGTNNATCDRANPCDTFQHALTATSAGGEIDVVDPGDFGSVVISQSVSIVADGVLGGIQVSGSAITVSAASTDVVVLRGLTISGTGTGSPRGINFSSGGALHVESCTISNLDIGMVFFSATHVFIKDTIVRNNSGTGIDFQSDVTASLDNVRLEGNGFGGNNAALNASDGTNVSLRNSVVAGNAFGLVISSSSRAAVVNLESTIVSGHRGSGILTQGLGATTNMSNVTVVNNKTGLSATSGGHIVSFGNNKITNNGTNGTPTQTITQK
jgi:hypothetical protein